MRDIELSPIPSAPADPLVDDKAYAKLPAGGIKSDTTAVDPARSDAKAYFKVSLGGEFGPARSALLSQPADGGVANLAAATTIIPPAARVPQPAPTGAGGRAWNPTTVLNLYPWRKVPKQGLDSNNPT